MLGEVPAQSKALGMVLQKVLGNVLWGMIGKVLILLFFCKEKEDEHLPDHFLGTYVADQARPIITTPELDQLSSRYLLLPWKSPLLNWGSHTPVHLKPSISRWNFSAHGGFREELL